MTERKAASRAPILRTLFDAARAYVLELRASTNAGWNRYWFSPMDPIGIAFVRICTGLVLTYVYGTCIAEVGNFVGPHAWVDATAMHQLRNPDLLAALSTNRQLFEQGRSYHEWYLPSAYLLTNNPAGIRVLYGVFLAAMICLTIGFCSRTAAVLAWVGHLSFAHRAFLAWFGIDSVLAMLTLYLLFAPSGAAWSVDSVVRRARRTRQTLDATRAPPARATEDPERSWSANLVIRLIQIHMCLIYLCAGFSKLQGSTWWGGQAVWFTFMIPEFRLVDVSWLAKIQSMPWLPLLLSNIGVIVTIVYEGGFAFLVHVRVLRPLVLLTGVALHGGIGLFMGLGSFGAAMLTGLASFLNPASLRWVGKVLFEGPAGYRFVFDSTAPRQRELASWVAAADPWNQVELVDVAASSTSPRAGTLIAPDGAALTGAAALGRLVRILRPLWLLWPAMTWKFVIGRPGRGSQEGEKTGR